MITDLMPLLKNIINNDRFNNDRFITSMITGDVTLHLSLSAANTSGDNR